MFSQKNEGNKLTFLKEAVENLTSSLSEEDLLKKTASYIEEITAVEKAVLYLVDESDSSPEFYFDDPNILAAQEVRKAIKKAFSAQQIVACGLSEGSKNVALKTISETCYCLPLKTSNKKLGVLSVFSAYPPDLSQEDTTSLAIIASLVASGIEKSRLQKKQRQIEELEREKIAIEIHDGIAQSLYHVILETEICLKFAQIPPLVRKKLEYLKILARESLKNVRSFMYGLRINENLSLPVAIKHCIRDFKKAKSIPIALTIKGEEKAANSKINSEVKTNLYYITQEALNNVVKHAEATKVDVQLEFLKDQIELNIKDDGLGFEADKIFAEEDSDSFGITGMKTRAKRLRGRVSITSAPGTGSEIKVNIPLQSTFFKSI